MSISRSFIGKYKPWGFLSLYVFIAMYGANTAILALHFIYRYLIICKHEWIFLLERARYIVMWIVIVFLWGFTYGFIAYYCFVPTEEFFDYARASVMERFNENIEEMSFFCVFIYEIINGIRIIHWKSCIGLSIIITMMLCTFTIMVVSGCIMVSTLRKVTMSEKTRMLQTQLLKALIFQATVPFLLSYLPRFLMFTFVLMGFPSHRIYTFVPVIITSYTALDPLAVMYFIHDYREAVRKLLRCECQRTNKDLWVASYSRLSYKYQHASV
ncbi:7TM chemoreceptor [Oesophagostomum dentatum]|uniref:7TM chemoreceptor n=1 Tax=Oesophagostomum dentatum TaxID=61180 RepID=A0A0B1T7Z2_OESDE|nr:7TM chemoreceptor [Oesophagostomum dentatum]